MKNKRVPEIRFTGFTGDWDQRKLGEISEKVTEKNKKNIYSETFTNSAEFGIINQRDFFDKDISNEKNLDGYYIVRPDDFVYNPRISNLAPVGPIKRNKLGRTGVMSPLYYVFRTHDVDKTYLEKYFSSNNWHKFMKLNGDSGARSDRFAIKDSVFGEMPIPYPSIEEQTKIGSFFNQLDEMITLHQQELTTIKQTKQGFLQKMFPKERESVPEIRFPGFTGEWEQRKYGEVIDLLSGQDFSPSEYNDTGNGIPYMTGASCIVGKETIVNRWTTVPRCLAEKGDVLLVCKGSGYGAIAVMAQDKAHIARQFMALKNLPNLDKVFNFYLLNSVIENIKKDARGLIAGIARDAVIKQEISIPLLAEQQKVGSFFNQLDNLITLHQRELDALKEAKKAFLQKMFV